MAKLLLVPVDLSDVTANVLAEAAALAEETAARLLLLHVVAPPVLASAYSMAPADLSTQSKEEVTRAKQSLETHAAKLRQRGLRAETAVREGPAVDTILAVADESGARLIVVGSHGHGAVYNLLVGSTTGGLLRQTRKPVLVVPSAARR